MININELKPHPSNPNTHTDEQLKKIAKGIDELGWGRPIIISKDNFILIGHGAYKAAVDILGQDEVPFRRVNHLHDSEDAIALMLADNRLAEESKRDPELLENVINELDSLDYDLTLTGYELDELDFGNDAEVEEDEYDIDQELEPTVQKGEVWQLGNHLLMCGDSTDKNNIKLLLNDSKPYMIFTDPPYGMLLDTDFSSMKGISEGNKYKKVIGDNEDFTPELIRTVFENFKNVEEIFLWGADYYAELIPDRNRGSWIVWDKMQNGEGVNDSYDKMFGSNFELCWSKKRHKRALARVLWKGIFGLSEEDIKKRVHPTQKPIKLVHWFLEKFSKENNNILDLYGGSGSTLIACEQLKRNCFMMELDPYYCDVIINRWEEFTGQKAEKVA